MTNSPTGHFTAILVVTNSVAGHLPEFVANFSHFQDPDRDKFPDGTLYRDSGCDEFRGGTSPRICREFLTFSRSRS